MSQNNLAMTLTQIDDVGQIQARRPMSFSYTDPVAGDYRGQGVLIDTNEATLGLPTAQPLQVMVRNTHASAKITVKWTPNGGAKVTIIILGPGDGIAFWNQATHASYGVSALYLTSDTIGGTYETFIGG